MRVLPLFFLTTLATAAPVDFARDVHPILVSRCGGCHSGERPQAGLAVATRDALLKGGLTGPAIIPGNGAGSLLIQRVNGERKPAMPMGGAPLAPAEIATLKGWIDEGAVFELTKLPPSAPEISLTLRRPKHFRSLDAVLDAYFEEHGVHPPKPVTPEAFVRRAYLDLWGLLPTPEQRDAYLAHPDRKALIDKLLANRQNYAEHWISFWNDLLHNDEGVTYIGDRKTISPWLLRSLESNLPYDRFVRALLDPQAWSGSEGFLIGVNWRGDVSASQTPIMQAAQNSAQVFLGVNLKCNSCHDSFISSWKLKDAYGLASFFAPDPLELVRCDVKTGKIAKPEFLFPQLGGISDDASLADRREAVAKLFTSKENGRFPRTFVNRVWRKLFGRGIVEPADDMSAAPWSQAVLDWLAADFVSHHYDIQHLLRQIMNSQAYRMPVTEDRKVFRGPLPRRLEAEQVLDAIASITGEWRTNAPLKAVPAQYSRDWRLKTDPLSRALGRPMRDLAVTERLTDPSTLQTLELVNGQTLATMLQLGSRQLLGTADAAPSNLYDSGVFRNNPVKVDVDITGVKQLRLLIVDHDSYDPAKIATGWADAEFAGPEGAVKIPPTGKLKLKKAEPVDAVVTKVPSELVYDIAGKGYTRFRATLMVDELSQTSDISASLRAFVFKDPPNRRQLIRVEGETPVPRPPVLNDSHLLVQRLYRHAFGRDPNTQEAIIAEGLLASGSSGLEDLLWILILSPEFQFIS